MSFKLTAVLLLLLAGLGGYIYFYGPKDDVKRTERPPFVYEIDLSEIIHLDVLYNGKTISMDWDEGKSAWGFRPESDIQGTIDQLRVNGVRLLLSGPGSNRQLVTEKAVNLKDYGLDKPTVRANVIAKNKHTFNVLIGDRTPNGLNNYVKLTDYDPVFLVDYTWAQELARFVMEPPLVKEEQPQ